MLWVFVREEQNILEKIKAGCIYSEPEKPEENAKASCSTRVLKCQTNRVKLIRDAETRLDELLLEKRQVMLVVVPRCIPSV